MESTESPRFGKEPFAELFRILFNFFDVYCSEVDLRNVPINAMAGVVDELTGSGVMDNLRFITEVEPSILVIFTLDTKVFQEIIDLTSLVCGLLGLHDGLVTLCSLISTRCRGVRARICFGVRGAPLREP